MKSTVRKLLNEWDQSLHLVGDTYWEIDGVTSPQKLFSCLPDIFPHGGTLLIEGLEMSMSAKCLYSEHPARYTKSVACDTVDPTPDSYHVEFSPKLSDQLCKLIDQQGLSAAFYHFKGYSEHEVIFTFHDAFEGELILSGNLPERTVHEFARALGSSAQREGFGVDQRQQLIVFDAALNPPWWNRALNLFKKRKS